MTILKVWDMINDLAGKTPLHPQYFVFKSQKYVTDVTLKKLIYDLHS